MEEILDQLGCKRTLVNNGIKYLSNKLVHSLMANVGKYMYIYPPTPRRCEGERA